MRALGFLALTLTLGAAGGCDDWQARSTIYMDLVQLRVDPPGTHYQLWVDQGGGTFSLGCYAVEQRPSDCSYLTVTTQTAPDGSTTHEITLNEQPTVVQCECPCTTQVKNPCIDFLAGRGITIADDGRQFTEGDVVGIVDHGLSTLVESGVEISTTVDLHDAERIYFSRESDSDTAIDEPDTTIMSGALHRSAGGLQGTLQTVAAEQASAIVSIIFADDGANL